MNAEYEQTYSVDTGGLSCFFSSGESTLKVLRNLLARFLLGRGLQSNLFTSPLNLYCGSLLSAQVTISADHKSLGVVEVAGELTIVREKNENAWGKF